MATSRHSSPSRKRSPLGHHSRVAFSERARASVMKDLISASSCWTLKLRTELLFVATEYPNAIPLTTAHASPGRDAPVSFSSAMHRPSEPHSATSTQSSTSESTRTIWVACPSWEPICRFDASKNLLSLSSINLWFSHPVGVRPTSSHSFCPFTVF